MKFKNVWIIAMLCVGLLLPALRSYAEDDEEESKVVKAADAIIEGLPSALKTAVDFSKMTPAQRIDFVLTGVQSKIEDDVADKFKEELFDKAKEMTKEAIRAKLFMEVAVPQIKNAYVMGKAFDWTTIDAQLSSQVDTRMNALSAGVKTIQIGWAAYKAYSEGDWSAAAKSVGGEITGMLAESIVPGYGYIKVGAEMVEFLGNYVLDYATDTAVEGMLNSMYGMKSNPQGFAQWLINKSPQDIMKDINDKFASGMDFGYVYKGQGTDSGEEEIKSKIQQTLVNLRGDLLAKKKEQEQKEQRVKQDIDNFLQKYRTTQANVKVVADKAKAEVDKMMGPILDFKRKVSALRKEAVQEEISKIESALDNVGSGGAGSGVSFVPFNSSSLISEMEGAYAEIKESPGSGYNTEAMERMVSAYRQHREEMIKKVQKENSDNCMNAVRTGDLEQEKQRSIACSENNRKLGIELAAFQEKEKIVELEAQERADKLSITLQEGMQKIAEGIRKAKRERDDARLAWVSEVQAKFAFPQLMSVETHATVETCAGICGPAETIKNGQLELYAPGSLNSAREEAKSVLEHLKEDLSKISEYTQKEKAIIKQYQLSLQNLRKEYESLVPEKLRISIGGGNAADNDERVKKYGFSAVSSETWSMSSPGFVNIQMGDPLLEVEQLRYFDQQVSEFDVLEQQRVKHFQEGIQNIETMISTIDFYADLDRIAVQIKQLATNLDKVLRPYLGAMPNVNSKDGKFDQSISPDESDGGKYLEQMKKAWQQYQPMVQKLSNNIKAYGKGLKYISSDASPAGAIAMAAQFESIPGRMEDLEKRKVEAQAEWNVSQKGYDEEIARLNADFKTLQDLDKRMFYPQTLKNLRMTFDIIFKTMMEGTLRAKHKDEYIKLRDAVEEYAKKREADDKAATEAYQRQEQAAEKAREEEAKRQAEERNREGLKSSDPAQYYGYKIVSVRVNTYPVDGVSGDIVVNRDKLVQGQIQVTAQLSHVDHVKTMLFSEDGGWSWKEIPVSTTVNYSFYPFPNKMYNPLLQIKTDDFLKVILRVIPNANGIIYKDEDFNQEVMTTVKDMADAYERQDFGKFSDLISHDFLGNKTFLDEGVRFDFDMFTDISLKIYVNRIEQRGDKAVVDTKWDKSQTPRKTGQTQKTTGNTTMIFVLEDNRLKIQNLRGDLIYATLSPEIAQASGLSAAKVDSIRTAHDARNPVQPGAGTTDDSGGTSSSSSSSLTVQTATVNDGSGFDLATGSAAAWLGGDFSIENSGSGEQILGSNIKIVPGATSLHDVQTATAGGYSAFTAGAVAPNEVYLIYMNNHYSKIRIVSVTGVTITIQYAYQSEPNNTDLTTQ